MIPFTATDGAKQGNHYQTLIKFTKWSAHAEVGDPGKNLDLHTGNSGK